MLTLRPHEIGIAVGYSRHGRPLIAIAAGECCKPAFAHQATIVVCAAVCWAYLRNAAGGAAKRAGTDAAPSGARGAQCHADVPGDGASAPNSTEPQGRLAGVTGVYEKRGRHHDQGCERRPLEIRRL